MECFCLLPAPDLLCLALCRPWGSLCRVSLLRRPLNSRVFGSPQRFESPNYSITIILLQVVLFSVEILPPSDLSHSGGIGAHNLTTSDHLSYIYGAPPTPPPPPPLQRRRLQQWPSLCLRRWPLLPLCRLFRRFLLGSLSALPMPT